MKKYIAFFSVIAVALFFFCGGEVQEWGEDSSDVDSSASLITIQKNAELISVSANIGSDEVAVTEQLLPEPSSNLTSFQGLESLPSGEQQSLWRAFSEARRMILPLTDHQRTLSENVNAHYLTSNPRNSIRARFLDNGVRLLSSEPSRDWQGELTLNSKRSAIIRHQGVRLEYDYGDIIEWYNNRPEGIQQGWIIPNSDSTAVVRDEDGIAINLAISGLEVEPLEGRDANSYDLQLVDDTGKAVLSYTGLKVWDATGSELVATMQPSSRGIDILVTDANAAYPITIDPMIASLEAKLTAGVFGIGEENDRFGSSVAMSGNTVLIGASGDGDNGSYSGCAYIFVYDGNSWIQQAKLDASDGEEYDYFGDSVSIDGDRVLIGVRGDDDNGSASGSAYVFERSGSSWSQKMKITPPDGAASDRFGFSVGISGSFAIIGAYGDSDAGNFTGSAYIFTLSSSGWTGYSKMRGGAVQRAHDYLGYSVSIDGNIALIGAPKQDVTPYGNEGRVFVYEYSSPYWFIRDTLTASDYSDNADFGHAVSVKGDRAVIGAIGDGSGSAYIFDRSGSVWNQEAKLTASDGASGDDFGYSVSVDGDLVLVGSRTDNDNGTNSGSAYVFARNGSKWTQETKLIASDGSANDYFGGSVCINGDLALIGAISDDDYGIDSGSAYLFTRDNSNWTLQTKLSELEEPSDDRFGISVSVDSDTALVGLHYDDDNGSNSGSAMVFVRDDGEWSFQSKLIADDGSSVDFFGISVSLSADTALVGAQNNDDGSGSSGSAYIFQRSGLIWTQQAKLTAVDAANSDYFGGSVSIDGETALIGASGDDDNGSNSGSAYVFLRDGSNWTQQAKLIAGDGADSDKFGSSLSVNGETALIGASYDDDHGDASGSAYVFVRDGSSWSQQAKLTATDGAEKDYFGSSVSISGETALIGAYDDDDQGDDSGSAYVFVRSGVNWNLETKLAADDGAENDFFGCSVSISGDTAVIGARGDSDNGFFSGSAYVFTRSGSSWSQQVKLTADDGVYYDFFGTRVSVSGDTVLVGVNQADGSFAEDEGAVYVFGLINPPTDLFLSHTSIDENSAASTLVGVISAADADLMETFVYTLVVGSGDDDNALFSVGGASGDELLTGAVFDHENKEQYSVRLQVEDSSGYTFSKAFIITVNDDRTEDVDGDGLIESVEEDEYGSSDLNPNSDGTGFGDWLEVLAGTDPTDPEDEPKFSEIAKVQDGDVIANNFFGSAVSIDGDTAIVGAYTDNSSAFNSGSVFVYIRNGNSWIQQAKLVASDGADHDYFGYSVGLSGDTAVVGAYWDDDNGDASGSAYVFVRDGASWTQQAKLHATDGDIEDHFGISVSIDKDTVVVGAMLDDDHGDNSGSAYVFVRDGTSWAQQAKLTTSDLTSGARFGHSVSLYDNTALVGAHRDTVSGTGSAYAFVRNGSSWSQQAKLLASDGSLNDEFGVSVDLFKDTAVIGAREDDDSGSAYVFERSGSSWTQVEKLTAADGAMFDSFGCSVSIDNDTILVGAYGDDDKGMDSGSAYVFLHDSSGWNQHGKLTAHDGYEDDLVGYAVDVDGSTALIGGFNASSGLSYYGNVYFYELVKDHDQGSDSWQLANGFDPNVPNDESTKDSDHDGDLDIIEIYQGTDREIASEAFGLRNTSSSPSALHTQFRRSVTQSAVNAVGKWSIDLVNWQNSGETFDGVQVSFSEELSESGIGYEIVDLTVSVTSGSSLQLFYKLEIEPNE